jgi:spore coat protein CotH
MIHPTLAPSRLRTLAPCVVLTLAVSAGAIAPSYAQTTSDLFNDSLQTLEITMHSRDWESLRVNFTSNDFYPADVTWNGLRGRNVGIRSRGLGSRSGVKPGLEVNFAHYSSRGRFLGMRALVLDNLVTDPSMIRERVAMAFLRRLGVAAPREVHTHLYVNGEYFGLYAIVEPIDQVFVQQELGESSGTLYEFHWLQPYFATFLGENLDVYEPLFEPRTREHQSTFDLYDPIRELFRTINSAPADSFRDALAGQLDAESTLRLIAGQAFLAEWDGILGYAGMNNFYLYFPGSSPQARIFPWDADHAFHAPDYPLLAGAAENVLMRRMLEDPVLRARFFQLANEAIDAAVSGDWLVREITTQYQQIRGAVLEDPLKPYTSEEFDAAFAELLSFARTRPAFVAQQIQQNQ